jgi:GPCR proteolysis site, GPS, motif
MLLSSLDFVTQAVAQNRLSDTLTGQQAFLTNAQYLAKNISDCAIQSISAGESKELVLSSGSRVLEYRYSSMQTSKNGEIQLSSSDKKLSMALPQMNQVLGFADPRTSADEKLADISFQLFNSAAEATSNATNTAATYAVNIAVKVGNSYSDVTWHSSGSHSMIRLTALDISSSSTFEFTIAGRFNLSKISYMGCTSNCTDPQCVYWQNNQWIGTGCGVYAVTANSITCNCTCLSGTFAALQGSSSFVGTVVIPIPIPPTVFVPNWATFVYACVVTGTSFICLVVFLISDLNSIGLV